MQWNGANNPSPPQRAPLRSLMDMLQQKAEPYVTQYGENYLQGSGPLFNSIVRSGVEMTPGAGDLLGIEDLQTAAQNNDWGGIGLGLLAAIPGIPAIGRGARGEARAVRGIDAPAAPAMDAAGDVGYRVQSSQDLAPTDTPESLRAQGYEIDPATNTWARTVATEAPPPAPLRAPRPERVPSLRPAMRGTDGKIYTADDNHFTAMASMPEDARRRVGLNDSYRGFVDDRGRYLNRARAQEYALNFGLLRDDAPSWARNNHELVSEYLRPYEPPAPVAPAEPDYPIRAYHGSPHSFDQFSLDKIGTGEGAQVYGHGLYFAENENVARQYREQLSRDTYRGPDGRVARNRFNGDADEVYSVLNDIATSAGVPPMSERARRWTYGGYAELIDGEVTKSGGDWASVPERLRTEADNTVAGMQNYGEPPEKIAEVRDAYLNAALVAEHANANGMGRNPGAMYEVGIDADPNTFLDWDKPLSEQPENVRAAFDSLVHPDVRKIRGRQIEDGSLTGPGVLRAPLGMDSYSDAAASAAWRNAGVPGIRYLDGNSRGAGNGSSNYVLFNDELVKILRKYGVSGLGFGVGGTALADELDRRGQAQEF